MTLEQIELLDVEREPVRADPPRRVARQAPALPAKFALVPENSSLLTRSVRKRRSAAIHGYVGLNGSFKTCTMVRDTLPSLALGRRVLSTVAILDPHTGNPHPLYVPFRSWSQLHDFRDGDVLLDEVTGIMDSRDAGMPKHIRRLLPQMRRRNVLIRWTGIDWDNSDKRLRQITQAATVCRGMLADGQLKRGSSTVDTLPMWAPNRLAFLTTYDASTMRSSDDTAMLSQEPTKKRRARVLHRELKYMPGSVAFAAYDTLAEVETVSGLCPVCDRRIPEQSCKTPDEHAAEWLLHTSGELDSPLEGMSGGPDLELRGSVTPPDSSTVVFS